MKDVLKARQRYIKNMYETLVLSGGSVKGFLTLGALQCLVDKGCLSSIKTIIGTSCGAILGYLIAIGYTPTEIMVYVSTNNVLDKLANWDIANAISGQGATSFHHLHEVLEKMTLDKVGRLLNLSELKTDYKKDLVCTTYNLTKDCREYLSADTFPTLPCITALRMSSNLPLVFGHFKYNHCYYTDGGIIDNFPIEYACAHFTVDRVIGINLEVNDSKGFQPNINLLEYTYRILFVPITELIRKGIEGVKGNPKIISLKCDSKKIFDFNLQSRERFELFSQGYVQAKGSEG